MEPFSELSPSQKLKEILQWFIRGDLVNLVAKKERKAKRMDIIVGNHKNLSDAVADEENVDITKLSDLFEENAYKYLNELVNKKRKSGIFSCGKCNEEIDDNKKNPSVFCDRCLIWYHFTCHGLKRKPRTAHWYCDYCIEKASV